MIQDNEIDIKSLPVSDFDLDEIEETLPPEPPMPRYKDWYGQNITQQGNYVVFDALMEGPVEELCFPIHGPFSVKRIKKEKQKIAGIRDSFLKCTNANNSNAIYLISEILN